MTLALTVSAVGLASDRSVWVTLDAGLSSMEVRVNPGMGPMRFLSDNLRDRIGGVGNGRQVRGRVVPIDSSEPLIYQVDLRHSGQQWGIAEWHGNLRITDWHDWLLVPVDWSMTRPFNIQVRLPAGDTAFLPFQYIERNDRDTRFRAYPVLEGHGGMALFGNLELKQVGELIVSVVGDDAARNRKLFAWAETVTGVARVLHGTSPVDAHVVIVPVPFVSGVVPWAHVRRGGGSHIIAYVAEDADDVALYEDWTLFHEMMHLYHPYLRDEGRWISEGFASYYQNVYRSQAGVIDPEFAWRRLQAGIKRGQKENSNNGHRPVTAGGRMRTYWTAAAMALRADIEIRRVSNDEQDLAGVIGEFAQRSLPASVTWHPLDYMEALDQIIGEPVLVPLYNETVRNRFFPAPGISRSDAMPIFTPQNDSR